MDEIFGLLFQGHWLAALVILLGVAGMLGAIGFIVALIRGKDPLRTALRWILEGL